MNNKQRQVLLELIDQYKKQILEKKRNGEREKRLIRISSLSVEFQATLAPATKAIDKLKVKLESEDWPYLTTDLPSINNLDEDEKRNIGFVLVNLDSLIHYMISSIGQENLYAISGCTKILVAYEMMYGFWGDSKKDELEEQLRLVREANNRSRDYLDKMSKGTAEVQMMIDRINSERSDLDALRNHVALKIGEVDNKGAQLAALIKKNQNDGDQLIKGINQKMTDVSANLEKAQTLVEQIESELSETSRLSEEKLKGFDDNLNVSNTKIEELKKMIGFVNGHVLGHSFNERKRSLSHKAIFWLIISFVFLIGAIFWICYVFTCLSAKTDIVWANILINVVKSSLAVFAFGYALNEYGKERNLQEEYAFKEAVAITLTTYLDQLGSCNEDEKKKLLVDTVEKLYTKPVISTKEYKMMQLDTKDIAEAVKPIAEVIKPLTNK